ncbi:MULTISPECIES: MFS transporter [Brucella/Ochrobactrum group]|uniref:MFS transporter n=1 Tax=Brucella/Ochrobactrum group TaxID=2826938 RepID=UPI001C057D80|nr:MFS transporter [Brucella sp. NBRC 12950]QWK81463.1 MHS family MFS transporter [Ochrobactrum sp. BTU1]GLU29234.1 MFS transporter [Brucella sp. NBRC 12950]
MSVTQIERINTRKIDKGLDEAKKSSEVRRAVTSALIGTALEWYDFYIFATAAALIFNRIFFPDLSPLAGTLAAFGTYAVGFFARPLGGIIFGRIGDLHGRKIVLVVTLIMMGFGTMLIGLLPTYASIGIAAPALLIGLRIIQGLAAGAEFSGAVTLAAEYAPVNKRGLYASLPTLGVCLGTLLSAGAFFAVSNSMSDEAFMSYGWRIPFLLSIFAVIAGIFVRLKVNESPTFHKLKEEGKTSDAPIRDMIEDSGPRFWMAFAARFAENVSGYLFQVWTLSYITSQLLIDRNIGLTGVLIGAACGIITIPLLGFVSDRIGRKPVYLFGAALFTFGIYPYFWLLNTQNPTIIVCTIAFSIAISNYSMLSVQGAFFNELFGARTRFTAISIVREVSAVFAGGIAPFIATALLSWGSGSYIPVAIYATIIGLITLIGVAMAPETRGADLNRL